MELSLALFHSLSMCLLFCILCHKMILFLFYKEDCGEIFVLLEVLFGALYFWREKRKTARVFLRFSFLSAAFIFFLLNVALTLFAAVLSQVCILFWGGRVRYTILLRAYDGYSPCKVCLFDFAFTLRGQSATFLLDFSFSTSLTFQLFGRAALCWVLRRFCLLSFLYFFLSFSTCKRYVVNVVVLCSSVVFYWVFFCFFLRVFSFYFSLRFVFTILGWLWGERKKFVGTEIRECVFLGVYVCVCVVVTASFS